MATINLDAGWQLISLEPDAPSDWAFLLKAFDDGRERFDLPHFPMQVHDVLLAAGKIENPNVRGINNDLWIHERDWAYRVRFRARPGVLSLLELDGADTFADVWLNGIPVGCCSDVYLTWRMDVSAAVAEENTLIVRFHAAKPIVDGFRPDSRYQGLVPAISALRIFRTGYHDYCGPAPCLIRCGLYGDVRLRQAAPYMLTEASASVRYDPGEKAGEVRVRMTWAGNAGGAPVTLTLLDADGSTAAEETFPAAAGEQEAALTVKNPVLWFPWTHGTPYVYRLVLRSGPETRDFSVGFRQITVRQDTLAFTVNGRPFRPWGANLMHLDTLTNCFDPDKMARMLDLARLANCNMLRIWGEADRLPQEFYDLCDRLGILLWQDFFLGCSLYSEEPDFTAACVREAEQTVLSLRHHPSVALWCGGNELYLARDYQHPGAPVYGERLVTEEFPRVCRRLDPDRCYRPSSPCGGRWANDPLGGDTHGYTHLWFVPGRTYPAFLSENCRVSPPAYRSVLRMMTPEELWPAGYHAGLTRSNPYEWPETWNRHTPNEGWRKLGPVEHFRDAETPRELVNRLGMAHAEYLHIQVGRFRRGRPAGEGPRRTNGHLLWRLNDNCNVISFGVVDYFLEPGPAFYEMKRCYQPFFACCELADRANIWLINDTPEAVSGEAEIFLWSLTENAASRRKTVPFRLESDESAPVCDLNEWGQFRKENIVCIRVRDGAGRPLCEAWQPCDIDRRLPYPAFAELSIRQEGDEIVLTARRYARAVELEGDGFGWVFEDNFFDLIPDREKRVRVLRAPSDGVVTARLAFGTEAVSCQYVLKG